ncbi:hypothetical protein TL5118_03852 [Thalassovita autumnalis]|uniref:Uncharacterized protein n=2 Tax=Thalassovita autumnalis TaxID=2072972 RepID=A0ABM9UHV7_9RHOB|nr:hypothetical protein TL5118_03852 [Thalassovita autumnalis]
MKLPRLRRPKLFEVIRYNYLFKRHASGMLLSSSCFEGKSILVAGPARTLGEDLASFRSDDFDVVIKMNNGIWLPIPFGDGDSHRCDVLFHSLTQDILPPTREVLDDAGVRCLVHRTTGKGRFPLTLDALRSLGSNERSVKIVPPARYKALSEELGGASPTTGLVCLDFLLGCNSARTVVAGFTFFQTKYQAGYDDRDVNDDDSKSRVQSLGHHNPERERALVRKLIDNAERSGRKVELCGAVDAALNS